jgi:hypothetical protein
MEHLEGKKGEKIKILANLFVFQHRRDGVNESSFAKASEDE